MNKIMIVVCIALCGATAAPAADYPQWRGVDGSGATADVGVECIEDMSEAKLAWKSEAVLPDSYDDQYRGADPQADGGFTAHSLYDGKIYVQYSVPTGDLRDENRLKTFAACPQVQEFCKVWADDVILCMDAQTGKTLWKQTFAQKGCHSFRLLGLVHTQPAIQDGKVYAVGSLGMIYCMDAKTGKPEWETTMGPGREWAIKAIEAWAADQAKGDTQKYIRDNRTVKVLGDNDHGTLFCTLMPQLAGDLLILNTGYQGDLAAFDLKTGKQRWCQKGVIQQKQSPTVWPLDGKYYVLHASGNAKENGALVCTDAATGERMWLIQDAPTPEDMGPTVSGPYIVVQGNWPKVRDGKVIGIPLTCFKADAKGATRLWTFDALQVPEYTAAARGWCAPVIYKGHVYFRSQAGDNVPPVFFACVEVASGKVKGLIRTIQSASYCSWMAAEGRAVTNWEVFDADPANFRMLFKPGGKAKMKQGQPFDLKYAGDALAMLAPNGMIQRRDGTWAKSVIEIARTYQTNILAGGFYYWRGPHHIYCYDLRKK